MYILYVIFCLSDTVDPSLNLENIWPDSWTHTFILLLLYWLVVVGIPEPHLVNLIFRWL